MSRRVLALVLLAACNSGKSAPAGDRAVFEELRKMHPVVEGKLVSTGGKLGAWELAPDLCKSGEHYGYFGADFYAPHDDHTRLRFVQDAAHGLVVKVIIPGSGGDALVFDAADCTVLDGNVAWMNEATVRKSGRQAGKEFTHVEGHLKLDCRETPPGESHVSGELRFSHCD